MRAIVFLAVLSIVAGCAGQPEPRPNLVAVQAPVGSSSAGANIGVTSPDIETQRLKAAKNLNLKVFAKDGQQLYCRSNLVTGSHIRTDTRCFTAEQLDEMDQASQRQVDTFLNRPDTQNPATFH